MHSTVSLFKIAHTSRLTIAENYMNSLKEQCKSKRLDYSGSFVTKNSTVFGFNHPCASSSYIQENVPFAINETDLMVSGRKRFCLLCVLCKIKNEAYVLFYC